jgi:hypothetical protein
MTLHVTPLTFYDSFEITIKVAVGSPDPKPGPLDLGDLYELKAWSITTDRSLRVSGKTSFGECAMDQDHRYRLCAALRGRADGIENEKLLPTALLGRIIVGA